MSGVTLRPLRAGDWPAVAEIYGQGIAAGDATFETEVPPWERWDAARLPEPRLVALRAGKVVGYAALSPVSSRPAYAGVAEVSVYVAEEARGEGVGRTLLDALVSASEAAGIWSLRAGIFPENQASLALHGAAGFRVVGVWERVGRFHDGRWRDVVLMERRSPAVGTPPTA